MNTCKTCKYWKTDSKGLFGNCDRIEISEDSPLDDKPLKDAAEIRCFVHDDSGLMVALTTRDSFGCNLHINK